MKKLITSVSILVCFLLHSTAYAQSGNSCTNPQVAALCTSTAFTANTANFTNKVTSWNGGSIKATGQDIYYQINLPTSSYNPVYLSAVFNGHFTSGTALSTVYFMWFESTGVRLK